MQQTSLMEPLCQKKLRLSRRELFLQKTPSHMLNRVINIPLKSAYMKQSGKLLLTGMSS